MPTVLDWFYLQYPKYHLFGPNPTELKSNLLLPLTTSGGTNDGWDTVYGSHDFHEVTMYYPMRVILTQDYHLIHNLNFAMPYPLATDLYDSLTFRDMIKRTMNNESIQWFKALKEYYYREQYELFDLSKEPHETKNVANDPEYLKSKLYNWRNATDGPMAMLATRGITGKYLQSFTITAARETYCYVM